MKVKLEKIKEKEKGYYILMMEIGMKENLKTIKEKEKEYCI